MALDISMDISFVTSFNSVATYFASGKTVIANVSGNNIFYWQTQMNLTLHMNELMVL